ncbi:hypothetical protein [Actinomadura sp. 6N118]|uniref:hypothetical protein n=1 Tax=Actinomadura sp. 6N118 TaxID=3375151 RepID=UPI00378F4569
MRCSTSGAAVTDLVDGFLPGLVRTAEGVPGIPHTAALGDTPRVLGRPGPAPALRPAPRAASGAKPTGLPPRERGVAAGRRSTDTTGTTDSTAVRPDHPRTPAPYAPAAPPSFTAGPAASSSNAAGPAIQRPCASPAALAGDADAPLIGRQQTGPLREGGENAT